MGADSAGRPGVFRHRTLTQLSRLDFIWRNATDGYGNKSADLDVGGKFGNVATATTPTSGLDPVTGATKSPWTPESVTVSDIYKDAVAFNDTVDCA